MRAQVLFCCLALSLPPVARTQSDVLNPANIEIRDIRIRVLNARNGKPIYDCLNISLGKWRGAELLVSTNREGVIILHVKNNEVTGEPAQPSACSNTGTILGPKPLNALNAISLTGDFYVVCQKYMSAQSVSDRIPTYPLSKIFESGIVAENTCGKFKTEAKPGELVIYARPLSFLEKWRS